MAIYKRSTAALIVIATALGAGCATTTQVRHQPVPPLAVDTPNSTYPRLDLSHLPHIGQAYYPMESRVNREEGICKMEITVESDGRISASHLVESSKFPRLDAACENAFPADVRLLPATKGGTPIQATVVMPIVWCFGVACAARLH